MNLEVSVAELARQLAQPTAGKRSCLRKAGAFHAIYRKSVPANPKGRWQTLVILPNEFLIFVDQFHGSKERRHAVTLNMIEPFDGGRRRYICKDEPGPLAVQPLGDYTTNKSEGTLVFSQHLANGRFLLAVTRDPDANVRPLNGWAVEIRGKGRVFHVMHSNRSRRLRPLGPIQTDAEFGLVEWPADGDLAEIPAFGASFDVLQATQVHWSENRKLLAETPSDVSFKAI